MGTTSPAGGPVDRPTGDGSERELLPTATTAQARGAVAELLRPHRSLAISAVVVLAVASAVGLFIAPLLGRVVDLVATGQAADALTTPIVLVVLAAVGQGVFTALGLSLIARLGEEVLAALRERFVERALDLPLGQLERAGSGDLTARVTSDVTAISEAVRRALPELSRALLTIGLTLVGLAVLDWRFLLVALLAVPVQAHTVRWYTGRALPVYAEQRVAVGAQQQQLLDTVAGATTVRSFRLADAHTERVTRRSAAAVELTLRGVRLMTRFYARLNLAEFIGLGAVLVAGFLLVSDGAVGIGTATAAALYFHNLFNPINTALALVDDAQSALASLVRLVGVTHLTRPPVTRPTGLAVPRDGTVELTGVRYAYRPGREVLSDITLTIAPKERVALVGASGAGKTTLAKLIAGVHEPTGGTIRIGGVPLAHLGAAAGRAVGLVTQEVHVFAGPLADDLRLARPDATDDELRAALDRVGALGWVRSLPEGLATVVGEGGHRLTAAQSQHLALARLVLADPPVVILDEATAEAGSAGARQLESAAAAALEGRTGLLVAHRLTQAATADRIIVLESGRIVAAGTHDELVAAGGGYAELWRAWSSHRTAPD